MFARLATIIKNLVRVIPAVVILAATLNTLSCRTSGGIGSSSSSSSPTSTSTAAGSLAFVTNSNDGRVSSFTRNTTTGVLTLTGQVAAGKSGPRGVVASPNGQFLYVANDVDDNIYEFSINQTNGKLTSLATVPNGNKTGPDELAISSNGTLLWVTNQKGTVGWYTINPSTGLINANSQGSIGGFTTPFGIAVHPTPTLTVLYVSDTATGLITPLSYNTSTGALAQNLPAVRSASPFANSPTGIVIDSTGDTLFTPDQGNGEVSPFSIATTGTLAGALTPLTAVNNDSTGDKPVGIGLATTSANEYLFTANFGGSSVSSFIVQAITMPITPPVVVTGYNAPKGLVVDPQNLFVYTADSGDGTVGQATIKNGTSCTAQICANTTIPTESPANPTSGPFGITLAQ